MSSLAFSLLPKIVSLLSTSLQGYVQILDALTTSANGRPAQVCALPHTKPLRVVFQIIIVLQHSLRLEGEKGTCVFMSKSFVALDCTTVKLGALRPGLVIRPPP